MQDENDPEFQRGLEAILAPVRARGASEEEIAVLTERAYEYYKSSTLSNATGNPGVSTQEDQKPKEAIEPPYPTTFAELARMIASGEPIPGIREIPDKLAEGAEQVSTVGATRPKKPWEK